MFSLVLSSRFQLKLRQLLLFQSKRHTLLNWPCKRNSSVYEGYSTHVFTIYRAQYTHVQEHVLIRSTILQKIYVNPLTRLSNSRLSYNTVLPRITYVFVLTVLIRSHSLCFLHGRVHVLMSNMSEVRSNQTSTLSSGYNYLDG